MINVTDGFKAAVTGDVRQMFIKAVIDLTDPDIAYGTATAQSSGEYSKPDELHNKVFAIKKYASLETNRWQLDGGYAIYPDEVSDAGECGYQSSTLSGPDGYFPTAQYVEMTFSNVSVLQACSVYFSDDTNDGTAEDFTVEVKVGGTAVYAKTYTGNIETSVSLAGFTVNAPDAIRVTVTKWSRAGRRMRVAEIVPGIYEIWDSHIIAELSINQQVNTSCCALPYGTATLKMDNLDRRFEPRSKSGLFQSIEERQGIPIEIGCKLADNSIEYKQVGVYYQYSGGWKTGDNGLTMQWDLVDIIGLLSDRAYIVPDVLPTTLTGWAASLVAQLGINFESLYSVDSDYASTPCTVVSADNLSGKTCGDVLRYVCMACGVFPRADAETGYLCIEPMWDAGNSITLDNMDKYPTMKANDDCAYVRFKIYAVDGTTSIYNIGGNSTASSKTISIDNPFIHTTETALTAAKQILKSYGGNQIIISERGDPANELGDVDSVQLDKSQATSARRIAQQFAFNDGVMSGLQATLIQPSGFFMYNKSIVLTGSGTWTAPSGITSLGIIVVGGGDGGTSGTDGTWDTAGVDGTNGNGGKVFSAQISINNGQSFTYSAGAGGAIGAVGSASIFGIYTSASGNIYDYGYMDINNGNVYGRSGTEFPATGTGDGGIAGKGGCKGERKWVTTITKDYTCGGTITGGQTEVYIPVTTSGWDVSCEPGHGTDGKAGANGCIIVFYADLGGEM
ncbi:hypothetical protein KQI82_12360 [Oscillibacter sp. MSJ-2]|uniref:Uncharacterized protein n=1 Tax=Dysosmobacter acutus TaxID=2841504 RepID=A0ABS6FC20_9FIRM|nr:hypothetical protein [Dysosmobacter acutus]MBU5627702.1 hypothetical protein [Dysosmobacter acutus]